MTTRSCLRAATALLACAASSLFTIPAFATTLEIATRESLPRVDAAGAQIAKRAAGQTPEGVNLADCLQDQRILFTLRMDQFAPNASVQAWASVEGTDCTMEAARIGPNASCWPLLQAIPLQAAIDVYIPVRRIVGGAMTPRAPRQDESACGALDRTRLQVAFLYFAPGLPGTAAVTTAVAIDADTVPSPPPSGLVASGEPGAVSLSWQGGDGSSIGTLVYCARVEGSACPPVFGGAPVAFGLDPRQACASVGSALATQLTLQTPPRGVLAEDVMHAFAVASVDDFGNVSAVSTPACATPEPGGDEVEPGGGCSVSRPRGAPDAWLAAASSAGLLALSIRAMRRRKAR